MRPLTFEERKELILRTRGADILEFVHEVRYLGEKYKIQHARMLALMERAPRPTNLPKEYVLFLRNFMAGEGKELTPRQCKRALERTFARIRARMLDEGMPIPEDDAELFDQVS